MKTLGSKKILLDGISFQARKNIGRKRK